LRRLDFDKFRGKCSRHRHRSSGRNKGQENKALFRALIRTTAPEVNQNRPEQNRPGQSGAAGWPWSNANLPGLRDEPPERASGTRSAECPGGERPPERCDHL